MATASELDAARQAGATGIICCRYIDREGQEIRLPPHDRLIEFVTDRPGHDRRYAIDASRIRDELGWEPEVTLEDGLRRTVRWYLEHEAWWQRILSGEYRLQRQGLG